MKYVVILRGWRPVEARTTVEAESLEEAERKAAEQDWDVLDWQIDEGGEITTVAIRDVYTEPEG